MTPLEFKSSWTSESALIKFELVQFPQESVSTLAVPAADRDFLTNIGLPKEAAPMLVFGSKRELSLPKVSDLLGLKTSFSQLRAIGFNNYGDPICIDESTGGKIVYLLHDGPPECRFMNSSVSQLAYSLLAFREAVKATNATGGRGAFSKGLIPPEVIREFVRRIDHIDSAAIQRGQFWTKEIHLR